MAMLEFTVVLGEHREEARIPYRQVNGGMVVDYFALSRLVRQTWSAACMPRMTRRRRMAKAMHDDRFFYEIALPIGAFLFVTSLTLIVGAWLWLM